MEINILLFTFECETPEGEKLEAKVQEDAVTQFLQSQFFEGIKPRLKTCDLVTFTDDAEELEQKIIELEDDIDEMNERFSNIQSKLEDAKSWLSDVEYSIDDAIDDASY